jgi:putative methanogen marker protein 4
MKKPDCDINLYVIADWLTMGLITELQTRAQKNQALIGIGVDDSKKAQKIITSSIKCATKSGYAEVQSFDSPESLISALNTGEIAGAVRGNLPAKETIDKLKSVFKLVSIYRTALICIDKKICFFLAPVGIDEGIFIDERLQFIKHINSLVEQLGLSPKTAIISGGRAEDYGRSGIVDESLQAGVKLFKLSKEAGFDVKHYGILIEEAYTKANIIIAPNGIVGNLLFRTLHYLGSCRSFGAPVLNMDKVFIDTSRSKTDYTDSIMLASALSNL